MPFTLPNRPSRLPSREWRVLLDICRRDILRWMSHLWPCHRSKHRTAYTDTARPAASLPWSVVTVSGGGSATGDSADVAKPPSGLVFSRVRFQRISGIRPTIRRCSRFLDAFPKPLRWSLRCDLVSALGESSTRRRWPLRVGVGGCRGLARHRDRKRTDGLGAGSAWGCVAGHRRTGRLVRRLGAPLMSLGCAQVPVRWTSVSRGGHICLATAAAARLVRPA